MKVTMAVDQGFRSIGEVLYYQIILENTLEKAVHDIVIKYILPDEVMILEGKVLDREEQVLHPVQECIRIETLVAGGSYSIEIKTQVEGLPSMHFMIATAEVSYRIEGTDESVMEESNTVTTIINDTGDLCDKAYQCKTHKKIVDREDEITYELTFTNRGNVIAQGLVLKNSIPAGTCLVEGEGETIALGEIGVGESKTITYTLCITKNKGPWQIDHQPTLSYYFLLANKQKMMREAPLRCTQTPIHTVAFEEGVGFSKSYSADYTDQGECLECMLTLNNQGNVDALDIEIRDIIPEALKGKDGQVQHFHIPLLKQGENITLNYPIEVVMVQEQLVIPKAEATYAYYVEEHKKQRTAYSNDTQIYIQHGEMSIKTDGEGGQEASCITLDEVREHQLILENEGNVPVGQIEVFVEKQEAYIIEGEGWHQIGNDYRWTQTEELQPYQSIIVPYNVKGQAILKEACQPIKPVCRYTYQVGDKEIKKQVQQQEAIQVEVIGAFYRGKQPTFYQKVDVKTIDLNEQVTYMIEIANEGNREATDIQLMELMPREGSYVEGSLRVNGLQQSLEQLRLPSVACHEICTVSYQVKINAIPPEGIITTSTRMQYTYGSGDKVYTKETSLVGECVRMKRAQVIVVEHTQQLVNNETVGGIGDEINCKVWLKNVGNTCAENICLQDQEEQIVGNLAPGQEQEVVYTVKIPYEVQCSSYIHELTVSYGYEGNTGKINEETNSVFEALPIEDVYMGEEAQAIWQEVSHAYAQIEDEITYTFIIKNTGNREVQNLEVHLPQTEGGEWLDSQAGEEKIIHIPSLAINEKIRLYAQLKVVALPTTHSVQVIPTLVYGIKQTEKVRIRQYPLDEMHTAIRYAKLQIISEWHNKQTKETSYTIGDMLQCYLTIKNTGNQRAYNIILQQWLEEGLDYTPGNIQINQIDYDDILLTEPIQLLDIIGDEEVIIAYEVQVVSLPPRQEATLNGYLHYQYQVDESHGLVIEQIEKFRNTPVKIEATLIDEGYGNFTHHPSQQEVDQNDTITYTVSLHNGGNCIAKNMKYQLHLSEGLRFVPNSLLINQQPTSEDLAMAIMIGDMPPLSTKEMRYQVEVEEGILRPEVWSYSQIMYDTQAEQQQIKASTHKQQHNVYTAGPLLPIHFKQNMTPTQLGYNDVIHMSWELRNGGNRSMIEPIFQISECLLENLEIYHIRINQMRAKEPLTKVGIILQDMEPGEKCYIIIEGRIKSIPKLPVQQRASITYRYESTPSTMKLRTRYSDIITLYISDTGFKQKENCRLEVDKKNAIAEDVLHYTVILDNQGNQKVEQLKVVMKGNTEESWPVFQESQIEAYQRKELVFDYTVPSQLVGTTIQVEGKIIYTVADSSGNIQTFEQYIEPVRTNVLTVDFGQGGFTKTINPAQSTLGEVLQYIIVCLNTGNTIAQDVKLYQQCPEGIRIRQDTLKQDGASIALENQVMHLQPLQPHKQSVITFDAQIERLCACQEEDTTYLLYGMQVDGEVLAENIQTDMLRQNIEVISPYIGIECIPQEAVAIAGEKVSYQLRIQNRGNSAVKGLSLTQNLPACMQLTEENKLEIARYNEHLGIGEEVVWGIEALVNQEVEEEQYVYYPEVAYNFELRNESYRTTTAGEACRQAIVIADVALQVNTDMQECKYEVGDYITYHIQLHNRGTVLAQQIILHSQLPEGCELVRGSLRIEEQFIGGNAIEQGITIGELQPQEKRYLTYKVAVKQYKQREINNQMYCIYHYKASSESTLRRKSTEVMISTSVISSPNKVEKKISYCWTVPYGHEAMEQVNGVEATAEIIQVESIASDLEQVAVYAKINYIIHYKGVQGEEEKLTTVQHLQEYMVVQTKQKTLNQLIIEVVPAQYGIIHPRQLAIVSNLRLQED